MANLFDLTRIHPRLYASAQRIIVDAFECPEEQYQKFLQLVFKGETRELNELDLVDYGRHLSLSSKGEINMIQPILQIKEELVSPYKTSQNSFETKIDNLKLFYLLSGEEPQSFRENSLAQVRVVNIKETSLQVATSGGIFGSVNFRDLFQEDQTPSEQKVRENFLVGQNLRAKILQIRTADSFSLQLSLKTGDLQVGYDFIMKNRILEKFGLQKNIDFLVESQRDFVQAPVEQRTFVTKFQTRQLTHPFFKNLSYLKAIELLRKQPEGSFIFRPSSSSLDQLNLTWKITQGQTVHLVIKEGLRTKDESISKQLILNKITYKSIDDIHENYIKIINKLVAALVRHKKFLKEPIDVVINQTLDEKRKSSQRIPYFFSFTEEKPMFLILTYIPDKMEVKHELIRIKPEGLFFHNKNFLNLDELINFYKNSFKSKEYQNFLKDFPPVVLGKKAEVKEERSKKEEERMGRSLYEDRRAEGRRDFQRDQGVSRGYRG